MKILFGLSIFLLVFDGFTMGAQLEAGKWGASSWFLLSTTVILYAVVIAIGSRLIDRYRGKYEG